LPFRPSVDHARPVLHLFALTLVYRPRKMIETGGIRVRGCKARRPVRLQT